ncbi:MAG: hypothetical protein FWD44_04720 [Oscillospiraceae bacterium]|nr:hypothetical protein [Oscillospiraceae bacterium]
MTIETKKQVKSIIASIEGNLYDALNDKEALLFVKSMNKSLTDTIIDRKEKEVMYRLKKCSDHERPKLLLKKQKYAPKDYPHNLKVGDIVHVSYGFGYCSEMSDGHYAIILSSFCANMYFVIPVSSKPLKSHEFYYDDLSISANDISGSKRKSYLRFDQMGSVHYRRLTNARFGERENIGLNRVVELFEQIDIFLGLPIDKSLLIV